MSEAERQKYEILHKNMPSYGRDCFGGLVLSSIESLSFHSALDIGCGLGQFALLLADRGKQVSAIDISAEAIRIARQSDPSNRIRFEVAEVTKMPFDHKFDLVTSFDLLEHLPIEEVDLALSETHRLCLKFIVFSIALTAASIGGMSLHLTCRSEEWWLQKLGLRFKNIKVLMRRRTKRNLPWAFYVYGEPF
jgi:ubiquinone/menaquinone biosynthesis C-methylase UbiE